VQTIARRANACVARVFASLQTAALPGTAEVALPGWAVSIIF
jgi:hypothetical protein